MIIGSVGRWVGGQLVGGSVGRWSVGQWVGEKTGRWFGGRWILQNLFISMVCALLALPIHFDLNLSDSEFVILLFRLSFQNFNKLSLVLE